MKNDYVKKTCLPECPLECNTTYFTYATSMHILHGNPFVDLIQAKAILMSDFAVREMDENTARKSIAKINVFYESLSYEQSEEAPKIDFVSFVANIGGNMGLFLSVNLFSFAEIITTLIKVYFFQRKKSNKVHV